MKRILLTATTLALMSGAWAQSSVTVFGVVDVSLRNNKNGSLGSVSSMSSGNNSSGRFGLRGVENLGGGSRAEFWLESDVFADTGGAGAGGTGSPFWNRRVFVALANESAGEVRFGRDYTTSHSAICALDPFICVGLSHVTMFRSPASATVAALGSLTPLVRANNAVQYLSPVFADLQLHGMVSAGEGATTGAVENSKATGLRLIYNAGPLNAQASVYNIKNTAPAGSPTFKDTVVGASYNFGFIKPAVSRRDFKIGAEKMAQTAVNFSAPVGGQGTLKFQFVKANQSGSVPNNDATLLGLGYQHDLSKRTALYATASRIKNKGGAFFTVGTPPAATAANFGGQTSSGYEIGLRHSF